MNVWWTAAGAVVVIVAAIGIIVLRARRPDLTLPPVSEQWLADNKRGRT